MKDRPHPGESGDVIAGTDPSEITRQQLEFDIKMALSKRPFRMDRGRDVKAGKIVEHLRMCGWEFHKKPPAKAHSTSLRGKD